MKAKKIFTSIVPRKLEVGDHLRIIAPSRSLSLLAPEIISGAAERLQTFGFKISFGKNVREIDDFLSSSVASRVEDIHEAFSDPEVDGILTAIGGYNANQLLSSIDYALLRDNPKVFCGFSDITVLSNAILAKSQLVTYSGPHFSSWAMKRGFEYSLDGFVNACMRDEGFMVKPSEEWSDDAWYLNQETRNVLKNEGYWILQPGEATGMLIGGHARCLSSLQGTDFWPGLAESILFIEEDAETSPRIFDRLLQSYIHQKDFGGVRGILIGRFQKKSEMTRAVLEKIIASKPELKHIPILANMDFGHTTPIMTLPIGGSCKVSVKPGNVKIEFIAL